MSGLAFLGIASAVIGLVMLGVWTSLEWRDLRQAEAQPPPESPGGEDLDVYLQQEPPEAEIEVREPLLTSLRQLVDKALSSWAGRIPTADRRSIALKQANLNVRPGEWLFLEVAWTVLLCIGLGLRFGSLVMLLVGLGLGPISTQGLLRILRTRRERLFESQLLDAMANVSAAMKSGLGLLQAFSRVAQTFPDPCGLEFRRITRDVELGLDQSTALHNFVERNSSDDVRLLVIAIRVHHLAGGNLTATLDRQIDVIRSRLKLRGHVRSLTAQVRASAVILSLLPVGLTGILLVLSPSYFAPMMVTTGITMLAGAGISIGMGAYIMQRIVNSVVQF